MKLDKAKAFIESNIPILISAMALDNWRINILYEQLEDGTYGQCSVNSNHMVATIQIDVSHHDDVDDLGDTLVHEFLHIHQAEQKAFLDAVDLAVKDDTTKNILEQLRIFGDERAVASIMLMFKRLGLDMKSIVKLRKQKMN